MSVTPDVFYNTIFIRKSLFFNQNIWTPNQLNFGHIKTNIPYKNSSFAYFFRYNILSYFIIFISKSTNI